MNTTVCALTERRCKPCEGGVPPLAPDESERLLRQLDGWERIEGRISKVYRFRNYYETMAFVNAGAWISHHEDHHPDLEVGYKECRVSYSTHAIGGLSENDFICAAKMDSLMRADHAVK